MNAQQSLAEPRARRTDPVASHEAASVVRGGNDDLVTSIRKYVWAYGSATHDEIADALAGERWTRGTVVTGCARAGLTLIAHGVNARGRKVGVYGITVQAAAHRLAVRLHPARVGTLDRDRSTGDVVTALYGLSCIWETRP